MAAPTLTDILRPAWREVTDSLAAIPYPRRCAVCGGARCQSVDWACDSCAASMPTVMHSICPTCRRYREFDSSTCSFCDRGLDPRAVAVTALLDSAWRDVIHALKYGGDRELALPLGRLMALSLPPTFVCDVIMPIPTDAAKKRERGYGHAELLAGQVGMTHSVEVLTTGLMRTRRTMDQTRLRGRERVQNLRGAFAIDDEITVVDKTVLVVDDVMTTGATIGEAARALTEADAKAVYGIVLCLNLGIVPDGR